MMRSAHRNQKTTDRVMELGTPLQFLFCKKHLIQTQPLSVASRKDASTSNTVSKELLAAAQNERKEKDLIT